MLDTYCSPVNISGLFIPDIYLFSREIERLIVLVAKSDHQTSVVFLGKWHVFILLKC